MNARTLGVLTALSTTLGCASSGAGDGAARLSALDVRIAVDERRAANLRADILQQEASLKAQRACMRWGEQRASRMRFEAIAAQALAHCAADDAQFHACEAKREQHRAHSTGFGCLLGGAAALLSGGALAAAALIGCGAGWAAGTATGVDCTRYTQEPNCDVAAKTAVTSALQVHGLRELPQEGPMPPWCAEFGFSSR